MSSRFEWMLMIVGLIVLARSEGGTHGHFGTHVPLSTADSQDNTIINRDPDETLWPINLARNLGIRCSALQCWDCASDTSALCGDPMNVTQHQAIFHTKTCEAGPYETSKPICRKTVKRVNGERVVIRQCSTPYVDEADIHDGPCGHMAISGRNVVESCHICSTDLCNSATSASVMQPFYIAALAVVSYHFYQTKYNVV